MDFVMTVYSLQKGGKLLPFMNVPGVGFYYIFCFYVSLKTKLHSFYASIHESLE